MVWFRRNVRHNRGCVFVPFLIFIAIFLMVVLLISCSSSISPEDENVSVESESVRTIVTALPHDAVLVGLTNPKFVSVREAVTFMADDELVLTVRIGDVEKIYPLSVLLWHEVVNDNISGVPYVVTYCPLCGSATVFSREIVVDGKKKILSFETSGKVYDSSMLFEDVLVPLPDVIGDESGGRSSPLNSSLFVSFNGTAIQGPYLGTVLSYIPSSIGYYRDFISLNPHSLVLSRETGYHLPYDQDPYTSYYTNTGLLLPVSHVDSRMDLKEIVIGVRIGDVVKAYPLRDLERVGVISDVIAGVDIRIERDETGFVRVVKKSTGEVLPSTRAFWFLWATHNPMTSVYSMSN